MLWQSVFSSGENHQPNANQW